MGRTEKQIKDEEWVGRHWFCFLLAKGKVWIAAYHNVFSFIFLSSREIATYLNVFSLIFLSSRVIVAYPNVEGDCDLPQCVHFFIFKKDVYNVEGLLTLPKALIVDIIHNKEAKFSSSNINIALKIIPSPDILCFSLWEELG